MPHLFNQTAASVRPYVVSAANTATLYAVVVEGTNDGEVAMPSGADVQKIVGVVVALGPLAGAAGDVVMVQRDGDTFCKAGASITRGDRISINGTAGNVKTAAPGAGTNVGLVGQANEAASSGDIFSVKLIPGGATFQG